MRRVGHTATARAHTTMSGLGAAPSPREGDSEIFPTSVTSGARRGGRRHANGVP